ncbi:MAG: MFS transporter [Gammaproteobacteria bacterium]|nr:MFS transporter [Gammaproteobacteria bacterium]
MTGLEIRATASVSFLYMVRMFGLFMVIPVLPLAADAYAGATIALMGLAVGVYGLSQGLLQIPFGLLSDRIGRKPVIYLGLALFIAGSALAAWAETIGWLIAARLLQGCGAIAGTLLALMGDLTRVNMRTVAMAFVGISIGVSFGLSLIAGPWFNTLIGLPGVFLLNAGLGAVGMVVVAVFVPTPTARRVNLDNAVIPADILQLATRPDIAALCVSILLAHHLLMSGFLAFPRLLVEVGYTVDVHHYIYLGLLAGTFVLMGPVMRLGANPRFTKHVLLSVIALAAGSLAALSGQASGVGVLLTMGGFFMAFNLLEVVLPAQLTRAAPAGRRGTAAGLFSAAQFGGVFTGGAVGGLLIQTWGNAALLYVNAGCAVLWFGLVMWGLTVRDVSGRVIEIADPTSDHAHSLVNALLSIEGIDDVVFVEAEGMAYLKIDNAHFVEDRLERLLAQSGAT